MSRGVYFDFFYLYTIKLLRWNKNELSCSLICFS
nr:MAG TPA: hypothetical protein [Caudoviricetes sp.]